MCVGQICERLREVMVSCSFLWAVTQSAWILRIWQDDSSWTWTYPVTKMTSSPCQKIPIIQSNNRNHRHSTTVELVFIYLQETFQHCFSWAKGLFSESGTYAGAKAIAKLHIFPLEKSIPLTTTSRRREDVPLCFWNRNFWVSIGSQPSINVITLKKNNSCHKAQSYWKTFHFHLKKRTFLKIYLSLSATRTQRPRVAPYLSLVMRSKVWQQVVVTVTVILVLLSSVRSASLRGYLTNMLLDDDTPGTVKFSFFLIWVCHTRWWLLVWRTNPSPPPSSVVVPRESHHGTCTSTKVQNFCPHLCKLFGLHGKHNSWKNTKSVFMLCDPQERQNIARQKSWTISLSHRISSCNMNARHAPAGGSRLIRRCPPQCLEYSRPFPGHICAAAGHASSEFCVLIHCQHLQDILVVFLLILTGYWGYAAHLIGQKTMGLKSQSRLVIIGISTSLLKFLPKQNISPESTSLRHPTPTVNWVHSDPNQTPQIQKPWTTPNHT